MLRLKDIWEVTFTTESLTGEYHQVKNEASDLVKVSRLIMSYVPKRGHEMVMVNVEKIIKLF